MTKTETQLPLLPEAPPVLSELQHVPLDRLPSDTALLGPAPERALVESIRRWGVLEPVLVRAVGGGLDMGNPATLVSGRRRIKALRQLRQEAREALDKAVKASSVPTGDDLKSDPHYLAAYTAFAARQRIPVRIISDPEGTPGDGRSETLAVMTNAVRSDNPATDFLHLTTLLAHFVAQGASEKGALAEVVQATGLASGTIKQRLRLLDLSLELQDDFLAGRLGYSVALHASRLGPEAQEVFAERLDQGEPATLALVKEAKRDAVRAHQTELFDGLPGLETDETAQPTTSEQLSVRAARVAETLRATRLPVCIEAADVITELLTADEDHRIDAENRSLT